MNALQNADELAWFVDLVRREGVKSYLEIGTKFGGTFDAVTRAMPAGSRAVAVDLPKGTRKWGESRPAMAGVLSGLKDDGYDVHVIWGDSTAADVIEKVGALSPFDLCLIDANHTLPFVTKDFQNYGPMADRVAFHDIGWFRDPTWIGVRIDVPLFWEQVKQGRRFEECKREERDNGIGVIWK